ncbi:hypothetical protein AtubIFM55763_001962 [Aspergillus tubingensis]|nr:hypothetical protein AtubIFM55763_001962 [Aspergillus tubingensis]
MASPDSTIVLITGANQGLGFEVAKKLATDHPGYHVLMGYRDAAKGEEAIAKLKSQGLIVDGVIIDVTDDTSIQSAAKQVADQFGRLDVLINNAGVITEGRLPEGTSLRQTWQASFDINTTGQVVTTEAFIPLLEKAAVPRIVFVSSALGSCTGRLDPKDQFAAFQFPAYRSSKAALNMIACHYASLYGPKGWKVNASDPGFCATNFNGFRGWGTPESGALQTVHLATLDKDGPNGTYSNTDGPLGW